MGKKTAFNVKTTIVFKFNMRLFFVVEDFEQKMLQIFNLFIR